MQVDLTFATRIYPFYDATKDINTAITDLLTAEKYDLQQSRKLCAMFLSRADQWTGHVNIAYKELSSETKYKIIVEQFRKLIRKFRSRYADNTGKKMELVLDCSDGTLALLKTLTSDNYK